MKSGDKVALVCCSNGQPEAKQGLLKELHDELIKIGLMPVFGDYIYEKESVFSGSAYSRAESLMEFYKNQEIAAVFDISGGDIANEILPYLDFDVIAASGKMFWGYSDLTTILNAIYTKTRQPSVLYQIKNIVLEASGSQSRRFQNTILGQGKELFDFSYAFLQKQEMEGVVVGGNIRCLLKLAGTQYWPDMDGKILLLEALSGGVGKMVTYLSQLKQIGVFEKISGILLGTFTEMAREGCVPQIADLVKMYAGKDIPVAYTPEIGHGIDAKAIIIGQKLRLSGCR